MQKCNNDLINLKKNNIHVEIPLLFYRPVVTQLAAPKIPEGERVDFDVCSFKAFVSGTIHIKVTKTVLNNFSLRIHWSLLGYP